MVKTATFESLLADARPDGDGTYVFVLEGKTYRIYMSKNKGRNCISCTARHER